MDELRRQIQQLHEHLKWYENRDDNDKNNIEIGSSSNNNDDVNPFLHKPRHELDNNSSLSQYPKRRNKRPYQECDVRVEILEFEGNIYPDELIN